MLLLLTCPGKATKLKKEAPKHGSLFFLPKEVETLIGREKKENLSSLSSISASGEGAAIYLGALLFQDHHNWTLWVNGKCIMSSEDTSRKLPKGFVIQGVSETSVIFSMQLTGEEKTREITLRPGQTYFPSSQEVWDGDHRSQKSQLMIKTEN